MACDEEELKSIIRSILVSTPDTLDARSLLRDFKENEGYNFPFQKLGHTSFVDYLRSIPTVLKLQDASENPRLVPVTSEKSSHVDKMVMQQKKNVPARKRNWSLPAARRCSVSPGKVSASKKVGSNSRRNGSSHEAFARPCSAMNSNQTLNKKKPLPNCTRNAPMDGRMGGGAGGRHYSGNMMDHIGWSLHTGDNWVGNGNSLLGPAPPSNYYGSYVPGNNSWSSSSTLPVTNHMEENPSRLGPQQLSAGSFVPGNSWSSSSTPPVTNQTEENPIHRLGFQQIPAGKPVESSGGGKSALRLELDSDLRNCPKAYQGRPAENVSTRLPPPPIVVPAAPKFEEPDSPTSVASSRESIWGASSRTPKLKQVYMPAGSETQWTRSIPSMEDPEECASRYSPPTRTTHKRKYEDTIGVSSTTDAYDDVDNNTNISDKMKQNFRYLLEIYPEGIPCADLACLYEKEFKVTLKVTDYGYNSVIHMVSDLPRLFSYSRPQSNSDWILQPADSSLRNLQAEKTNRSVTPRDIIQNITKLVSRFPEGLPSDQLLSKYQMFYNKAINLDKLGYDNAEDFINDLKSHIHLRKVRNSVLLYSLGKDNKAPVLAAPPPPDDAPALPDDPKLKIISKSLFPEEVCGPDDVIPYQELPRLDGETKYVQVRISDVVNPYKFWIHLQETFYKLGDMMADLDAFYKNQESFYKMPKITIKKNQLCAVLFPVENKWHRASITSCANLLKVGIEYIDYGTESEVEASVLRFLHKDFATLPIQAIKAKLMSIRPPHGCNTWPSNSCYTMMKLMEDKILMFEAHIVNNKEHSIEGVMYDTNQEEDIVINDELVKQGYASFIATPPPTGTESGVMENTAAPDFSISSSTQYTLLDEVPSTTTTTTTDTTAISSTAIPTTTTTTYTTTTSTSYTAKTTNSYHTTTAEMPNVTSSAHRPPPGFMPLKEETVSGQSTTLPSAEEAADQEEREKMEAAKKELNRIAEVLEALREQNKLLQLHNNAQVYNAYSAMQNWSQVNSSMNQWYQTMAALPYYLQQQLMQSLSNPMLPGLLQPNAVSNFQNALPMGNPLLPQAQLPLFNNLPVMFPSMSVASQLPTKVVELTSSKSASPSPVPSDSHSDKAFSYFSRVPAASATNPATSSSNASTGSSHSKHSESEEKWYSPAASPDHSVFKKIATPKPKPKAGANNSNSEKASALDYPHLENRITEDNSSSQRSSFSSGKKPHGSETLKSKGSDPTGVPQNKKEVTSVEHQTPVECSPSKSKESNVTNLTSSPASSTSSLISLDDESTLKKPNSQSQSKSQNQPATSKTRKKPRKGKAKTVPNKDTADPHGRNRTLSDSSTVYDTASSVISSVSTNSRSAVGSDERINNAELKNPPAVVEQRKQDERKNVLKYFENKEVVDSWEELIDSQPKKTPKCESLLQKIPSTVGSRLTKNNKVSEVSLSKPSSKVKNKKLKKLTKESVKLENKRKDKAETASQRGSTHSIESIWGPLDETRSNSHISLITAGSVESTTRSDADLVDNKRIAGEDKPDYGGNSPSALRDNTEDVYLSDSSLTKFVNKNRVCENNNSLKMNCSNASANKKESSSRNGATPDGSGSVASNCVGSGDGNDGAPSCVGKEAGSVANGSGARSVQPTTAEVAPEAVARTVRNAEILKLSTMFQSKLVINDWKSIDSVTSSNCAGQAEQQRTVKAACNSTNKANDADLVDKFISSMKSLPSAQNREGAVKPKEKKADDLEQKQGVVRKVVMEKSVHVFWHKEQAVICTDELICSFTKFTKRTVVNKVLDCRQVVKPYFDIMKVNEIQLFDILKDYPLDGVPRRGNLLPDKLSVLPLRSVPELLQTLGVDYLIITGFNELINGLDSKS